MAKSGFWLRGSKGKLAGTVIYQSQGSTIQREIVTPKNPQSDNQMRQRAAFAGASKFYQNAQQNRFVLAFQNKKGNQSEFNAFMQKNLKEIGTLNYPTREQANTPEFCNYFPWICTEGNLQSIPAEFSAEDPGMGPQIIVSTYEAGKVVPATNWDEVIALNPTLNLQYGDIITVTIVLSDEVFDDKKLDVVVGNIAPRWITRQIVIGTDLGSYTLDQYFSLNGFFKSTLTYKEAEVLYVNLDTICNDLGIGSFDQSAVAAMICVTRSRHEGSQLKVSPSRFYLTDMAQRIFERLSNDTQMREAIESYKKSVNSSSTPSNILQGSVAEDIPVNGVKYTTTAGSTTKVAAPVTGLQVKGDTATGATVAKIAVGGDVDIVASKVKAVAEGYTISVKKAKWYGGPREQGSHSIPVHDGAEITLTKSGTSTGNTPFTITYAGVQVAAGSVVVGS